VVVVAVVVVEFVPELPPVVVTAMGSEPRDRGTMVIVLLLLLAVVVWTPEGGLVSSNTSFVIVGPVVAVEPPKVIEVIDLRSRGFCSLLPTPPDAPAA